KTLVHLFPRIPKRGTIYDRNGQPLAVDADLKVVGVVPDLMNDKELTIASLARALQMPVQEVRSRVDVNVPSFYFVPVQTLPFGTTDDQAQPFFDMKDLGVVVQNKTFRVYPHGDAAAHVLGYMREVTEEQLKELAPKGYGPGDRVGDAGLEGQFETELAGQRGGVLATIAPEGNIVQRITQKPAQAGQDIYLSIDINIQKTAEAALGERTGSVVVLDPRDNSVLALASYPRFDPNDFIKGLTPEAANRLINDPRQPFLHRPLLATYPPGSTFKVVTGAAGLERGGFSTGSTVRCTPLWYGLGAQFVKANWQSVDRGSLTIAQGLMASCNPVFYEVALALDHIDPNILPQFARAFGFGAPSGIGMEEAAGNVPDPKWKEENLDEPWFSGDSVNMGIGQGFLLVTPLQIANLYSSLASGAELRKPLLVRKIVSPNGATREFTTEVIQKLPISESTLAHLRQGLTMVTQDPGGTSYRVFLGAGVDAAGKSGTAEDLAFGSDHVFFVAYANRANPSIVALMALEEGKSGSAEAAPKVRQILETHVNHS
ncbi:MAG TPA: penicillin-binding protein 2, partial [Dehalococcoidia bacterium]|nr:penicillin-binding protein 2 [Dehalococcoidia bacterium]